MRQEHRQELVRLVKQASAVTSTWRIWDDLMFMSAATLSQPLQWNQKREDEYLRRISQYEPQQQTLFPMMFAEIVLALEQEGITDVLGEMYMELELYNHWRGQFFTPEPICRMMGRMVGADVVDLIKQQGFITVNDPCCGSGAMLIAFTHNCMDEGVNFQHDVLFVGQDVDPVVARMCYIQMSLLGMPGYVIIGNSLLHPPTGMIHPECDYLFTPMYFINGFQWRRQKESISKEAAIS
jgi:type I restriction-modification system DNA methylase subunit